MSDFQIGNERHSRYIVHFQSENRPITDFLEDASLCCGHDNSQNRGSQNNVQRGTLGNTETLKPTPDPSSQVRVNQTLFTHQLVVPAIRFAQQRLGEAVTEQEKSVAASRTQQIRVHARDVFAQLWVPGFTV